LLLGSIQASLPKVCITGKLVDKIEIWALGELDYRMVNPTHVWAIAISYAASLHRSYMLLASMFKNFTAAYLPVCPIYCLKELYRI